MAGNRRKARIAKERQRRLDPVGRGWRRFGLDRPWAGVSPIYIHSAVLLTVLAVLPLAWGIYPIPYHLGAVASRDIESRVSFGWVDLEAERRSEEAIKRNYARLYREVPQLRWITQVTGPLWEVLDEAKTKDAAALMAYAEQKSIALTEQQAEVLSRELHAHKDWIKPFSHIVAPFQKMLREKVHERGLLSEERYQAERNQSIRIANHLGEVRQVSLAGESRGPIHPSAVRRILDEGFSDRMHRLSRTFRTTLRDILLSRMQPSLEYDKAASDAELRQQLVQTSRQINEIQRGEVLLRRGERIWPSALDRLRAEERAFRIQRGWKTLAERFVGKTVLILAVLVGLVFYLCPLFAVQEGGDRRMAGLLGLMLLLIAVTHLVIHYGLPATLIPIGLLAGLGGLLVGSRAAVSAVTGTGLIFMVLLEGRPGVIGAFLASGWLFASVAGTLRHRLTLLSTALLSGLVAAIVLAAWRLAAGETPEFALSLDAFLQMGTQRYLFVLGLSALAMWFVCGILLVLLLPLAESALRVTTNISLQELQDQEHPCLRQLVVQAPGTYHHSVIVGTLAEAAAESVGANPLLARVSSYYHDIGKLMKPEYFAENEAGVSRHDSLAPTLSALIIIAHVKDGAEMAREYALPRSIIDVIEQHHGKGLVSFFHHRAQTQAPETATVSEAVFRYPGPIPQCREAALVMLADSVEASSRAMERPTPAHIRKRVRAIIMDRLLDRQLDSSGLTLTDLTRVEEAFVRILTSMFHSRVKYPDETATDRTRNAERRDQRPTA